MPPETERLSALRDFAVLDTPPEPEFDDLVQLASVVCNAPIALVSLLDEKRQWFKAKIGLDVTELPREHAICERAVGSKELVVLEDVLQDERFRVHPLVTNSPHVRFYAGAPLVMTDGSVLGTICVLDLQPRTLSEREQWSLSALARQVVTALELRRALARAVERDLADLGTAADDTPADVLRLLIEQSGDGIIYADESGTIRLLNPEAARQHGVGLIQVGPESWARSFGLLDTDGRELPLARTPLYRALHGELVSGAHWIVRRPDGQERLLTGTATPVRRADGTPAGAMLVSRDETERVALEQRLARESARVALLLQSTADPVYGFDEDGRCTFANDSFIQAIGLSADTAVLGRDVHELIHHTRVDGTPYPSEACPLVSAARHGVRVTLRDELLFRVDGSTFFADCAAFPLFEGGRCTGAVATIHETTERRANEETLRNTARFQAELMGILSHDLRNPLNAVLGLAEVLQATESQPLRLGNLERIIRSAKRMSRMIDDMLDLTRIRFGNGIPTTRRYVDLRSVARTVVDEVLVANPGRHIELSSGGNLEGYWDGDRLAQLVGNLLSNAIRYGDADAPVVLTLSGDAERVRLSVRNRGEPIADSAAARIFGAFERGGATSDAKGVGLGLYIASEIARAHGGALVLAENSNRTVVFSCELPRGKASAAPVP
jgi:PAS domain S-box-containing protein